MSDFAATDLLPGMIAHHQPDLVQAELVENLIGHYEMAEMRWVEAAAQQANMPGHLVFRPPTGSVCSAVPGTFKSDRINTPEPP